MVTVDVRRSSFKDDELYMNSNNRCLLWAAWTKQNGVLRIQSWDDTPITMPTDNDRWVPVALGSSRLMFIQTANIWTTRDDTKLTQHFSTIRIASYKKNIGKFHENNSDHDAKEILSRRFILIVSPLALATMNVLSLCWCLKFSIFYVTRWIFQLCFYLLVDYANQTPKIKFLLRHSKHPLVDDAFVSIRK